MTNFDQFLGPASPRLGWVPAPRYLLRRDRILRMLAGLPAGRLLEIGPGAGALLVELTELGFDCLALEASEGARDLLQTFTAAHGYPVAVVASPDKAWSLSFDLVCAFEVLEHIEDDHAALAAWVSWLKPGGCLLLSVPAHMKLWNAGDQWAGHHRRYERDSLTESLQRVGLSIEEFECYGFPLANLLERLGAPIYARRIHREADIVASRKHNNDRSGIDRSEHLGLHRWVNSFPGRTMLRLFLSLQSTFKRTDLGSGYLVKARRL